MFFLSLNMPDSAGVYYKKVVDSGYDEDLAIKSLYSIAEVELLQNRPEEAEKWHQELEERAPNSIYTERLAERLGIQPPEDMQGESQPDFEMNVVQNDSLQQSSEAGDQLAILDSTDAESIRPFLLLDEAKTYMQQARNQPGFDEQISQWFDEQQVIESKRDQFEELRDSAQVMLADTALAEEQQQYWQQIADSTFQEPEITEVYPFDGAYWDSTRSILQRIETEYSASTVMPQVQVLQETLVRPHTDSLQIDDTTSVGNQVVLTETETQDYPSCEEAGITMNLQEGMDAFMNSLAFPEWTEDVSLRGELEYLFVIEPDGEIQSYEQLSRMDRSGIPQAVESGIESSLTFSPYSSEEPVECTVVFPFNL